MIRLALFFTFEISLDKWRRAGMLERELALYRKLAEKQVQTILLTWGGAEETAFGANLPPEIRIIPLFENGPRGKWSRFFSSWYAPVRHRALLAEMDVIKTNQMWGAWTGLVSRFFSTRIWILRCGFEHHRFLGYQGASLRDRMFSAALSSIGYRMADRVVFSNHDDLDWAARRFHFRPDNPRLRVIPNYVDTQLFRPTEKARDDCMVLCVGRLERQKNLSLLIEAMPRQGCRLEVIGEGTMRPELEAMAAKRRIDAVFHGALPQAEVARKMSRAAVFVIPSLYEGMPKALLEAMSAGAAVIGTDVPGVREFISHDVSGLLSGANPDELRRSIELLLSDRQLRERLGEGARRQVLEHYSLDSVAEMEYEMLRELTGKG